MIAKQYLITGTIMGVIGILMSIMFRMQIAWPEESNLPYLKHYLGKWAPDGVMDADIFGISYHSRYHYGILCTYSRIKWYI